MRYLIFSDTHLEKNFDEKKFNFLKKIISKADRIIINGDFWEGYNTTFDEFVDSSWKNLFPLLKTKKTVYIYGNHDKKKYSDERTSLFSQIQKERFKFVSGDKTFIVEHGDRLTPFWDSFFTRMPAPVYNFLNFIEEVLVKTFGMLPIKLFYERFNKRIKKEHASSLKKNEYLICGHTSLAEIDLKNHFINTGWIKHNVVNYITIEEGKITLHEEKYA